MDEFTLNMGYKEYLNFLEVFFYECNVLFCA